MDKFVCFKPTFERVKQRGIYDENEMLFDAGNALKGVLPGSGQFDRAMKILEEKFGNVRKITNANLKVLKSHPQVQGLGLGLGLGFARNCNRKVKCGIDGCTDNHHKL